MTKIYKNRNYDFFIEFRKEKKINFKNIVLFNNIKIDQQVFKTVLI